MIDDNSLSFFPASGLTIKKFNSWETSNSHRGLNLFQPPSRVAWYSTSDICLALVEFIPESTAP